MRVPQKLVAWLVLALYLCSGIASGKGFVVCIEADGSAALELAGSGCGGCPGTEGPIDQGSQGSSELTSCACIDVPLPLGSLELQTQPKPRDPAKCGVAAAALPAASCVVLDRMVAFDARAHAVPRPAPTLALIQTVILRV